MGKLVKEGILSKTGRGSYTIIRQKKFDYEFDVVKEELDGQAVPAGYKVPQVDDPMYMKALYHALQMKYVTVAGLQNKLDGEANQTAVRKLTNRMSQDGFLEAKGNRRLGKRVIHSRLSDKKLMEAKKAIGMDDAMKVRGNLCSKSERILLHHRQHLHSLFSLPIPLSCPPGQQEDPTIFSKRSIPRYFEQGRIQKLIFFGLEKSSTSTLFKQARWRCHKASSYYKRLLRGSIVAQTRWRGRIAKKELKKLKMVGSIT